MKRIVPAIALFAGAALLLVGVTVTGATKKCPLPAGEVAKTTTAQAQTPEQDDKKVFVTHNGKVICVSTNSADAHAAHGDTIGAPCGSPAN